MKKYVLIAGVNGAGKSTLYQVMPNKQKMLRVNTDEIVKRFGDWRNISDVLKAGKIAVGLIKKYMQEGESFNQETTLCGKSILKNIQTAKEKGYFIEVHYVGVDTVDIAKKRVKERVLKGGHGIPEKDIEKRYVETFKNFNAILKECDLIACYDNTVEFRRFAIFRKGKIVRLSKVIPDWFTNNVIY